MFANKNNKYIFNIFKIILLCILIFQVIFLNNINVFALNTSDNKQKILYLTFDDGPSIITNKLLDTLKECNVKATFFVVGKEIPGREDMLKRIYDEGHSIGLHTYSHNFKKIYNNENTFIDEMYQTKELIEKVSGCSTNLIRFPGGSSKHLSNKMLEKLHENHFRIYDWTLSLEDGTHPNLTTNELIKNSKKEKAHNSSVILLMHCNSNNLNTVKALPQIIEYYRSIGYEIKPITAETPEYHYKIKKS